MCHYGFCQNVVHELYYKILTPFSLGHNIEDFAGDTALRSKKENSAEHQSSAIAGGL
jgi:hypothetical protein